MDIGTYYMALQVKDLQRSLDFYRKLGFEPVPGNGSPEEKWLLIRSGAVLIGLFQDMFPKDVLVFQSDKVRELHLSFSRRGLPIDVAVNIEEQEGPCHFALMDPDGHPLLFDQPED